MSLFTEQQTDEGELLGQRVGRVGLVCRCGECWRTVFDCDPSVPDGEEFIWWLLDANECYRPKRKESPSGDGGGKDDEPGATKGPR